MHQPPAPARLPDVTEWRVTLEHPGTKETQIELVTASSATSAAYIARQLHPGLIPTQVVEE